MKRTAAEEDPAIIRGVQIDIRMRDCYNEYYQYSQYMVFVITGLKTMYYEPQDGGRKMKIGKKEFVFGKHTYVMGILNVTPDSFSDGGNYIGMDQALYQAERMIAQGADIIDIGGESTHPGYTMITDEEEIDRVVTVLRKLKEYFDVPVSVDTYKTKVAQAVFEEGADLLNDIWGLKFQLLFDGKNEQGEQITDTSVPIAQVAAKAGVPVCIMHNRKNKEYGNFFEEMQSDLLESVKIAIDAGIPKDQLILDPGVGFAKSYAQNLESIAKLEELKRLGYPVLLGTSRKLVIGLTLDLPVTKREEGTLVTTVMAAMAGCEFVRVHDVEKNVRAIRMYEAIRDWNTVGDGK